MLIKNAADGWLLRDSFDRTKLTALHGDYDVLVGVYEILILHELHIHLQVICGVSRVRVSIIML